MKTRIAILSGALALAAIPASAGAVPTYTPGGPDYKPAPPPPPPPHAKAHGKRCQGKSKKHVKGEKGTEFSRCVKALAKAKNHPNMPPGRVCKKESKEHEKGQKGTDFSRCVKMIAKLRHEEAAGISKAAQAQGPPAGVPPHGPKGDGTEGPEYAPAPPPQAKAHGVRCQGKSRKHVEGEQGTEFSRCVKALAQAADHPNMAPGRVCKDESKKHEKGQKGTDFSRCVKLVVQQRKEEREAATV